MGKSYPNSPRPTRAPNPPSDMEIGLLLGLLDWHQRGMQWCVPASLGRDMSSKLARMVRIGLVERRNHDRLGHLSLRPEQEYRLTPAGRDLVSGPEGQRVLAAARAATPMQQGAPA